MAIQRFDGTRIMTEDECDKEFTGKWALLDSSLHKTEVKGGLLAIAEENELITLMNIKSLEFDGNGHLFFCSTDKWGMERYTIRG